MTLNVERRADDVGVAGVDGLPGAVAEHDDGRGRRRVVLRGEYAASESADAENGEIISGDVFGAQGASGLLALAADGGVPASGLKRGDLFEFGRLAREPLEQRIRIHAPVVLRAAFDAAIVAHADAVESGGVGDGQRPKHDRVNQSEDGGGAADAESHGEDGRGGEDGRLAELAQGVDDVGFQSVHRVPSMGLGQKNEIGRTDVPCNDDAEGTMVRLGQVVADREVGIGAAVGGARGLKTRWACGHGAQQCCARTWSWATTARASPGWRDSRCYDGGPHQAAI